MEGTGKSRGMQPEERYASFDYCFNYFQAHREQDSLPLLTTPPRMQVSCLQLGYYLASWGMLRGSGGLFQKSVKAYEPVIRAIAEADPALWSIDANCYDESNVRVLLDFKHSIARSLHGAGGASDILTSKIMLGVFGNVPAFDVNFKKGLGVSTFGSKALFEIAQFYEENQAVVEEHRIPTVDFTTGQPTSRRYTRAKIIDMIFFIEGAK
jgi:hypothetical protein